MNGDPLRSDDAPPPVPPQPPPPGEAPPLPAPARLEAPSARPVGGEVARSSPPRPVVPPDLARLDSDQWNLGASGWSSVAGALLRAPGAVFRSVEQGGVNLLTFRLLAVFIGCHVAYGAMIGTSSETPAQVWHAAAKLGVVGVGALAICLPTFHVFGALLGSRLTLRQSLDLLLCLGAPAGIMLVSFAPIAGLFGVSTASWRFMFCLHVVAFWVSLAFGVLRLRLAQRYLTFRAGLPAGSGGFLVVWLTVYGFVLCQLFNYMRPFMDDGEFFVGTREFFLDGLTRMMAAAP
ncbi:MAG: hypothetical protein HY719_16535 [Planctomycetes bacterium]|nr:hypothetical protein [Planctomycetota bacterium]